MRRWRADDGRATRLALNALPAILPPAIFVVSTASCLGGSRCLLSRWKNQQAAIHTEASRPDPVEGRNPFGGNTGSRNGLFGIGKLRFGFPFCRRDHSTCCLQVAHGRGQISVTQPLLHDLQVNTGLETCGRKPEDHPGQSRYGGAGQGPG
jgi:hypothetical protein